MINHSIQIVPRYGEVDRMGYVYHANYVDYCHQGRTELMRNFGLSDAFLEKKGIMMPVISFEIKYKKPVGYDEILILKTRVCKLPTIRLSFDFEFLNIENELVSKASSTVVFVDADSRKPQRCPIWIEQAFSNVFNKVNV